MDLSVMQQNVGGIFLILSAIMLMYGAFAMCPKKLVKFKFVDKEEHEKESPWFWFAMSSALFFIFAIVHMWWGLALAMSVVTLGLTFYNYKDSE